MGYRGYGLLQRRTIWRVIQRLAQGYQWEYMNQRGKGFFEVQLLMVICQDYHFCHFLIIMKTHPAYSSEQIQKYLKFKKTPATPPNTHKEQAIDDPLSNPPVESSVTTISPEISSFRIQIESDPGKFKASIDKIALLKQRYLKKYRNDKPDPSNAPENIEERQKQAQTVSINHPRQQTVPDKKPDFQQSKLRNLQEIKENRQRSYPDKPIRNCEGSSIVHDIIVKRFNQALHLSNQTSINSDEEEEESQTENIIHIQAGFKLKVVKQRQDMFFDEQYIDQTAKNDFHEPVQTKARSLQQKILLWLHFPANMISQEIPYLSLQSLQTPFVFGSSNKGFSPAIGLMISSLVLESKRELSQGQRKALYHLAYEYFYRNASELTAELLIILIKLGKRYLQQNLQSFTHNLQKYCMIILNNRTLFTIQQRVTIVNFLLQQGNIGQKQIGCLVLIQPTQKLVQRLSSKAYSMHESIFLLACVSVSRKQFAQLAEVELRLICTLCNTLSGEKELLEETLVHVKEMAVGESLYQLHKQTKLKLIQMLSDEQRDVKVDQPERTSSKLVGYWSKAVDRLKNATTTQQQPAK